jgi:hypothetical protein
MATAKDALNAIESHEKECKLIYKSIDARLWGVYPFILVSLIASRFVG